MLSLTPDLRRTARLLVVLLVALLLGASVGAPAVAQSPTPEPEPPTATASREDSDPSEAVAYTAVTVTPTDLAAARGQSIRLKNTDPEARARFVSTSDNWSFDSGPLGVGPSEFVTIAGRNEPGTYTYEVRYTVLGADDLVGTGNLLVDQPQPTPAPSEPGSPSEQPSAGPSGSASGSPSGSPSNGASPNGSASPGAAGSPPPAGGSGTTGPLPLTGGFGTLGSNPVPVPGDPLAPAIAPPLALGEQPPAPLPYVAAAPPSRKGVTALPTGSLPGSSTPRGYGLPALLAALAIVGLTSLLVRVLLAEPAARREAEAARGVRPVLVTG